MPRPQKQFLKYKYLEGYCGKIIRQTPDHVVSCSIGLVDPENIGFAIGILQICFYTAVL